MQEDVRELIEKAAAVLKTYGAKEVYVFGSAATGKMRESSDIDLAVTGLPANVYYRAIAMASDAIHRDVDVVDLDDATPFTRYLKEHDELQRVA